MENKHTMDFSNGHTVMTIISGVLLGLLGLFVVLQIDKLGWLEGVSPVRLILYAVITILAGTYIHEIYHQFIARLMGHNCSIRVFPIPQFPALDNLAKWEALGIKLAPGFDLSLIAGLIIAFLPSPFNPILSIFFVGNLAGSANDLIQSYYIFKLSSHDSCIRLTDSGFEIWE
jgi:hypothetical protein